MSSSALRTTRTPHQSTHSTKAATQVATMVRVPGSISRTKTVPAQETGGRAQARLLAAQPAPSAWTTSCSRKCCCRGALGSVPPRARAFTVEGKALRDGLARGVCRCSCLRAECVRLSARRGLCCRVGGKVHRAVGSRTVPSAERRVPYPRRSFPFGVPRDDSVTSQAELLTGGVRAARDRLRGASQAHSCDCR